MLVYDITSEKSFDNMHEWIRTIERVWINILGKQKLIELFSILQRTLNECL
jgi:hypothetical protein